MGIIHKFMKQRYVQMDVKTDRKCYKNRILTVDGNIIESITYSPKTTDSENEEKVEQDYSPDYHIIKLYTYLADKTKKHKQLNSTSPSRVCKNLHKKGCNGNNSLWSESAEQLYPDDDSNIMEADDANKKTVLTTHETFGEDKNHMFCLRQEEQQQGKRDILLKIRHQILERKRLRAKLHETSTQVWRPW